MSARVVDHGEVSPRARSRGGVAGDGPFYPREVLEILGAPDLDYRQLRALFRLVREQAKLEVPPGWAQFSVRDLAAARVALDLARAPDGGGRRLQIAAVKRACEALRRRGVADPLLEVRMERSGRTVFALVDGDLIDPVTGQVALAWTAEAVGSFLDARGESRSLSARQPQVDAARSIVTVSRLEIS